MPKMKNVFGNARLNLMLAMRDYILGVGETTVSELVTRFGYSEEEILGCLATMNRSDLGDTPGYAYTENIFWLDDEALAEGRVEVLEFDIDTKAPKLSVRQVAAITAGLQMLMSLPHFEHKAEAEQLLAVFGKTPTGAEQNTIAFVPQVSGDKFDTLRDAILDSQTVLVDYIDSRGKTSTDRELAPLKLQAVELTWYLHAWDIAKDEHRLFKLDGISKVTKSENKISEAVLAQPVPDMLYQPDDKAITVAVEVAPDAYRFVNDFYGVTTKRTGGIIQTEVKVNNLRALAVAVASYGGSVKVIGPDEARKAVRDYALGVLEGLN